MTSICAQTSIFLRIAALTAAIVTAALLAATPAAGEYNLDIPGGGNVVPPPLTTGEAPTTAAPTGIAPTTTGETATTGGKKGKGKKGGRDKKKRKLPELGPDKPGALAAPVSAVARGTTPGVLPLAGVLVALLLATLTGRRLIRNRAA